jgi:signal transduction histidine kinase
VPHLITPERYQPQLSWWSHGWRFALCLLISAANWGDLFASQWHDYTALFWIDLIGGILAYGLVCSRRRWPLSVAVLTSALTAISSAATGAAALAAVSYATRRKVAPLAVVGLTIIVAAHGYTLIQHTSKQDPIWINMISYLFTSAALLGWGMYIGSRRELVWTLRDRAERAEAEQQLRASNARNAERSRIAREMHDVLAHHLSQVSMHAGALAFREDLSANAMRTSAGVIQTKTNEALNDLRSILGVLRAPETGELIEAPQPTYEDLQALIDEARKTGMHIEFSDLITAGLSSVPVMVGRTLYRIVQEGLTNARKHAPGAVVRIKLNGSPEDGVTLELSNPMSFTTSPVVEGAGLGLIGLAERAELGGGRLVHNKDTTSFVLNGWIPWAT